jgi:general secretion pathway protein C
MQEQTGMRAQGIAARAVVGLAAVAAVAALAAAGAYWTWAWFAPRPEPVAQAPMSAARLDAAYQLFGSVRAHRSDATPAASTVFRLLGLVAASGEEPGYAVLKLDAKAIAVVREGEEIDPGTRVVEVNADHVVLDRRGMRETLALPQQGKSVKATHAR